MKLHLNRTERGEDFTLGELFLNNVFQCYTLEDAERETDEPISEWKIKGKTAIPRGVYPVTIDYSIRFKRLLPRLLKVPGFSGIRIHPGNDALDTEGCILVGDGIYYDKLIESRAAFTKLYNKLLAAYNCSETITITIR